MDLTLLDPANTYVTVVPTPTKVPNPTDSVGLKNIFWLEIELIKSVFAVNVKLSGR